MVKIPVFRIKSNRLKEYLLLYQFGCMQWLQTPVPAGILSLGLKEWQRT